MNRDLREIYLENDKLGKKTNNCPYPGNISLKNYTYFLFAPTLCYEPEYPRSGPFRPKYFLIKTFHAIGAIVNKKISKNILF